MPDRALISPEQKIPKWGSSPGRGPKPGAGITPMGSSPEGDQSPEQKIPKWGSSPGRGKPGPERIKFLGQDIDDNPLIAGQCRVTVIRYLQYDMHIGGPPHLWRCKPCHRTVAVLYIELVICVRPVIGEKQV
jgi:hypothetical protein